MWRVIPGWEWYEASDDGQVRSLDRPGRPGRVLVQSPTSNGYLGVQLSGNGRRRSMRTHWLVMLAFVGPRPDGWDTRHLNGIKTDNRLANLRYGTKSENEFDKVTHGTHRNARKVACPRGHPLSGANVYPSHRGRYRECRTCRAMYQAQREAANDE